MWRGDLAYSSDPNTPGMVTGSEREQSELWKSPIHRWSLLVGDLAKSTLLDYWGDHWGIRWGYYRGADWNNSWQEYQNPWQAEGRVWGSSGWKPRWQVSGRSEGRLRSVMGNQQDCGQEASWGQQWVISGIWSGSKPISAMRWQMTQSQKEFPLSFVNVVKIH